MIEILRVAQAIWVPVFCALVYFVVLLPILSLSSTITWVFLQVHKGGTWCAHKLAEIAVNAEL